MSAKVCSILAAILVLASANSTSNTSRVDHRVNDTTYVGLPQTKAENLQLEYSQKKWSTELFLEARNGFEMKGDLNPLCRRDFAVYQQFLENQTVWAIRMSEASQWPSFGLLSGITHHLGNWDECLKATPKDFNSQYCLVSVKFNFTYNPSIDEDSFEWNSWPGEQRSAWDVMQLWSQNENRISRQEISWAMCIPASCRPADLEIAISETVHPVFKKYDMTTSVQVLPKYCKTNEKVPYPISLYIICILFSLGILHSIMLTVYESNIPDDAREYIP
ncbi:hypothetical protein V9T40_005759 [Parthenolecanium corni]|uniref:Nose resistant-to-fluoxetine protein N-terminal domain-containing protein n=1 Tax=Parthenolecanium corni TaxID=536013 RepID=A0AAN9TUS7_9HEMI